MCAYFKCLAHMHFRSSRAMRASPRRFWCQWWRVPRERPSATHLRVRVGVDAADRLNEVHLVHHRVDAGSDSAGRATSIDWRSTLFRTLEDRRFDRGRALALPDARVSILSSVPAREALEGVSRRVEHAYPDMVPPKSRHRHEVPSHHAKGVCAGGGGREFSCARITNSATRGRPRQVTRALHAAFPCASPYSAGVLVAP